MVFQAISEVVNLPIDRVRYIVLILLSYPLALFLRHGLHPRHTSLAVRHAFSLTAGLAMGLICFGWQMMILVGVTVVSYFLLLYTHHQVVQRYTMVWAMGSLSAAHIYRMVTDYEGYHLDFTGPLMILVLRLTYVAFEVHDGHVEKEQLKSEEKKETISARPSLLEYLSYTLTFKTLLIGAVSLSEYRDFIDGTNMKTMDEKKLKEPSPLRPVLYKLSVALVALAGYVALGDYPTSALIDPTFYHRPLALLVVAHLVSLRYRAAFYFICHLVEGMNNTAGLGFRGYDQDGQPLWDIATVCDPLEIELATSPRNMIRGWNRPVQHWLRRVCYSRVKWNPLLLSFLLSATWHGFYPSYYFGFVYLGLTINASRKMRHWLRPYFQGSTATAVIYDIITCVATQLFFNFALVFLLYTISAVLEYWSYYYYIPLIIVVIIGFLPTPGKKHTN